MDIKNIRELAEILKNNGLSKIDITEGSVRITLESKGSGVLQATPSSHNGVHTTYGNAEPFGTTLSDDNVRSTSAAVSVSAGTVTSPLVGTAYLKPGADEPPFVSVGSRVKKGDVLCLVEAMKMFNDITADRDGVIREICVSNGDRVDYGQPLFIIAED